ncbi:glycosyltransferase [Candidatus Woesearchaeota archaeon]|nr:glycosyltransferase [Candidatus Woesearchaeota archaeon]
MTEKQEKYDLIVGIPSYNEADSIAFVVNQVDKGLKKHYPYLKSAIVNVDNNSPDDTKSVFLSTKTETDKHYITTPPGTKGKGRNFHNLFKLTKEFGAKGVVVVDADLRSITPDWMMHLGSQIFKGADFVSPIYLRHKYDGTITNNLVYPLVFSLIGKNVRQPIGGDFAFSGRLAEHWLVQDWKESTFNYGIDNFMTLHALLGGFNVAQSGLGVKDHKPSAPKLGQMFIEVVDTLFENLLKNMDSWEQEEITEETPIHGLTGLTEPKQLSLEDLGIDIEAIKTNTTNLFNDYKATISSIVNEETFGELEEMFAKGKINLSSEQWAKTVYDFMAAFYKSDKKLEIVETLKPMYFARMYSFVNATLDMTSGEAEKEFLKQAQIFRSLKPYLLKKLEEKKKLLA